MNEFKNYHPIINLIYFTSVFTYSMCLMNPVCLVISLASSFIYSVMLKGKKALLFNFIFLIPLLITAALFNPLFNHQGITILLYFPNGNPLTLESLIYGFGAATMIVSVICWFSCLNEIMTEDKIIYLFGKAAPSLALVISMTLRFVPRLKIQLKEISKAQFLIGRDIKNGSIIKRIKCGLNILSILTTNVLENSIETAYSMKSRGFGLPERTSFSIFTFDSRDKKLLCVILLLNVYIIIGILSRQLTTVYYPEILFKLNPYVCTVFLAYLLLSIIPILVGITEEKKWRY